MASWKLNLWKTLKVLHSCKVLHMAKMRTTASISLSKQKQWAVRSSFISIILNVFKYIFNRAITDISVSWWKVRENCCTINSFPVEGVVRKLIEDRPTQLLSHKEIYWRVFGYLRKLWAVSKCVWQEENWRFLAKLFFKEMLSVEKLSGHGFAIRNISVKFNPGTSNNLKSPSLDSLFKSFE